jgi:hypothetical protein
MKPEIKKAQRVKRGPYVILTQLQQALIGKRVAENGVTAAIRHFSGRYEGCDLKETFKKDYLNLRRNSKRSFDNDNISELPWKKRGCPLLLV